MYESRSIIAVLAAVFIAGGVASTSNAAVILADDFTGVSKSGSNASITSWNTEQGLSATTSFPAVNAGGSPVNYFDVNAGELDVNSDVWTPTSGWDISFDVTLDAGTTSIDLTSLDLVSWSINNSGGKRTNSGAHTWTLTIVGDGAYGTQSASSDASYGGGQSATAALDLTGLGDLVAGENYTFTLGVREAASGSSNTYATLDSFSLEGTVNEGPVIPEPASLAMGLIGLGLVAVRRRLS